MASRTALIDQLREPPAESGIVIPQWRYQPLAQIAAALEYSDLQYRLRPNIGYGPRRRA